MDLYNDFDVCRTFSFLMDLSGIPYLALLGLIVNQEDYYLELIDTNLPMTVLQVKRALRNLPILKTSKGFIKETELRAY